MTKARELANLGNAFSDGALSNRNRIINGDFSVNQRGVSGTVTLSADSYGHDRWKAGASGCTYTFATSANVTTITITAGSLQQIVEGVNLQSGTHVLSWSGTVQMSIDGGSAGGSGVTASLTGGTNATVETSGTGTLSLVQLEVGDTATPFEHRSYGQELALCQRYFQKFNVFPQSGFASFLGYFGGSNAISPVQRLTTPMRVAPSVSIANSSVQYYSFGGAWTNTTLIPQINSNEIYYVYCASDADGRSKLMRNGSSGTAPQPVISFDAEL